MNVIDECTPFWCLILILSIIFVRCQSESELHSGHLRRFGSSGPYVQLNEVIEGQFMSTSEFFNSYVLNKIPLIFRGESKRHPAYKLWSNDKYLKKKADEYPDYYVNVESVKKESRQQQYKNMTFKNFLEDYKAENFYLVSDLPNFLRQDVALPTVLQCGQAPKTVDQTIMWFSSGGTKSVTHTDDYENILCLFAGRKNFVLIDYYKYEETANNIIDIPDGSYSSMDVDSVNYTNYPGIENVEYYKANLKPGDCLYVPFKWIHQVESFDRNIAVNFWFNYEKIFDEKRFPDECENNEFDVKKTLNNYIFNLTVDENFNGFRLFVYRQLNLGYRDINHWIYVLKRELGDGYNLVDQSFFEQTVKEVFDFLDLDGSGYLEDSDVADIEFARLDMVAKLIDDLFANANQNVDDYDDATNKSDDNVIDDQDDDHTEL